MGDEHGGAAGADRSTEATRDVIGPGVGEQRTGLPPEAAQLAGRDAEQYYLGLLAQLEAEAEQVRAHRGEGLRG